MENMDKKAILVLLFLLSAFSTVSAAAPTVTLNNPNTYTVIGESHSVDFNVSDEDNDNLSATLYYSQSKGDFNIFIADLNLNDYSNYAGLSCDSTIFLSSTNCTYDWNLYRPGVSVKDADLVLFQPLDTYSFRDYSTKNNHGTGPNFDKTGSSGVTIGKQNRALLFDGTDDYILIPDSTTLDIETGNLSIELWAKRSAIGATHVLVDKRDDATNGYLLQLNSSNQVEAQICDGSCATITSTTTITDSAWHYIAVEFDRSGNGQIYLDGSTDGAAVGISARSGNINTAAGLRIGSRSYGALSDVMSGSVDEVRIYKKLLGSAEISRRYTNIENGSMGYRISDANFFLDLNVWELADLNASDSSSNSFGVDNNNPSGSDDAPAGTQNASFTVTFSCDDTSYAPNIQSSGCSSAMYQLDSGKWKASSVALINSDGNHLLKYYIIDAAGNNSEIYTTYASLVLGGHTFSFGLVFDGNWRSSIVNIPGFVSDQNMQDTLTQTLSSSANIPFYSFKLGSLLIGLLSTGSAFSAEITNSDPTVFNAYLSQVYRAGVDEEFYVAYTTGNYKDIEDKVEAIEKHDFLDRVNPAFGVATKAQYIVTIGLDYYDSDIDINGNIHLGPGTHSLDVTNQGYSGGKVVIGITES